MPNKNDGALASQQVFGRFPAFGLKAPTILDVATTQTVAVRTPVTLWARLVVAVVAKAVWAVVIPRFVDYRSGQPARGKWIEVEGHAGGRRTPKRDDRTGLVIAADASRVEFHFEGRARRV